MTRHPSLPTYMLLLGILLGSCSPATGPQEQVEHAAATLTVKDEIHFTGLIGWAKHETDNAYWAFLVDADCDTANDPSPPNRNLCSNEDKFEHEPYLLFHNARFDGPPLVLKSYGIYVNVSGKASDPGTNLDGISLKKKKIDFDLAGTLSQTGFKHLISQEDIPQSGWELEIARSFFDLDPGDSDTDYLQAVAIVDSGELVAANTPPLTCDELPQTTKNFGLASDQVPCTDSKPRFYSEDVFLYSSTGSISFKLDGDTHTVVRVDPNQPLKLFVLNVHPKSWRGLLASPPRACPAHHVAFRWLYGLAQKPKPSDYGDHFETCDNPDDTTFAADRRCPQIFFN